MGTATVQVEAMRRKSDEQALAVFTKMAEAYHADLRGKAAERAAEGTGEVIG